MTVANWQITLLETLAMKKWADNSFNKDPILTETELVEVAEQTDLTEEQVRSWFGRYPLLRTGLCKPQTVFDCKYLNHYIRHTFEQELHPEQSLLILRLLDSEWCPLAFLTGKGFYVLPVVIPLSDQVSSLSYIESTDIESEISESIDNSSCSNRSNEDSESENSSTPKLIDELLDTGILAPDTPSSGLSFISKENSSTTSLEYDDLFSDPDSEDAICTTEKPHQKSIVEFRHDLAFQGKVLYNLSESEEESVDSDDSHEEDVKLSV